MTKQEDSATMRLDKWLWCARFYKTRGLATEAIKGGKVMMDGRRCKPARTISAGDRLVIRKAAFEYDLTVTALSKGRKSARDAAQLYEESPESVQKRGELADQIKLNAQSTLQPRGRPTKRDRRELIRFKSRQQGEPS